MRGPRMIFLGGFSNKVTVMSCTHKLIEILAKVRDEMSLEGGTGGGGFFLGNQRGKIMRGPCMPRNGATGLNQTFWVSPVSKSPES